MKFSKVIFHPMAELAFTDEEVQLMIACSRHHYDGTCKAAGEVGGFLYGISNRCRLHNEIQQKQIENEISVLLTDADHLLNFRQIDTLCKMLELFDTIPDGDEHAETGVALIMGLKATLKRLNELARLSAEGTDRS